MPDGKFEEPTITSEPVTPVTPVVPVSPVTPEPPQPPPVTSPIYNSDNGNVAAGSGSPLGKILLIVLVLLIVIGGGILAIWKLNVNLPFKIPFLSSGGEVSKAKTTITYWGLWEPGEIMAPIIEEWKTKHPEIEVNYQFQSKLDYRERLQSAMAKGSAPDIFRYHISWVPMIKDSLEPVPSSVISASDFESAYYPVISQNLRVGTGYVGVPMEVDTLALFYNEDILQKAGQAPPTNWNELQSLAKLLVIPDTERPGSVKRGGVALGTTNNVDHWSDILGLLILQNSGDPAVPTSNQARDALAFYSQFFKDDKVWDETLPSSTLAFATEKVAMYFGFSWDVFEIKNINPNLKFRVIPVPQTGSKEVNWGSFWVEGVTKESKNKAAAWEFLKFMSSPETLQKLYALESKQRLFGEPYPRKEMASLVADNQTIVPFLTQAQTAKTWFLCSRTYDNGINDNLIKYFEDAVNAVNKGADPASALATTAEGITQVSARWSLGK